jgi:hypothetical protein
MFKRVFCTGCGREHLLDHLGDRVAETDLDSYIEERGIEPVSMKVVECVGCVDDAFVLAGGTMDDDILSAVNGDTLHVAE